ncbi:MAG: anthranilate synthase component I family protein, partial [Phycisphaerae bacterium]|jgi:anthranilate synthase component 1
MEQYVLACNRTASQTARNLVFSSPSRDTAPMSSRTSEPQFTEAVRRAKEHIHAGEIFQVVLSRRFDFTLQGSPLDLYKKLRATNPSPYMYLLNFAELQVLGSSPEMLVKLEGRRVVTRPLAGTRPRGSTPNEDIATEKDLLADEKERAEHVMLVDLARNDLGRVCKYGTVRTTEFLDIERYSRVIHLVSHVVGELAEGLDAFDVLRATFPAGTVSGAPKVRSMEIIDELETARRGVYAGAIGYFSVRGDMDMCIAIRTIVVHNRRGFIQAGAGIVADSEPDREFAETLAKASGLIRAVNAEKGAA